MKNMEKGIINNEEFDLICEYIKLRNESKQTRNNIKFIWK